MGQEDITDDERDRRSGAKAFNQSLEGTTPVERAFFRGLQRPTPQLDPREVEDDDVGIDGP